jgi:DNA-binding transcriptional LysR family regulator
MRLLDRGNHASEITAAGRALLPDIRTAVDAVDRLRLLADVKGRELSGELVIGAIGAEAATAYTHPILRELHTRHPQIKVEVRSCDFLGQATGLLRGEIDAAFLRLPVPAGVQTRWRATEPRVAALCSDDPLAGRHRLELAGYAVVDVPPEARGTGGTPGPSILASTAVRSGTDRSSLTWRRSCTRSPSVRRCPSCPPRHATCIRDSA